MEKEFVPYEPSLVLKELGFDGKCLAGFYTYADENLVLKKINLLMFCTSFIIRIFAGNIFQRHKSLFSLNFNHLK